LFLAFVLPSSEIHRLTMCQEATNALERVDELWFPDANLILRAENKLFRVYGGVLGARSSVFRDMVAFPQPAHPEGDIMDGIPVVRLHDSAGEVEEFLRAVFDSRYVKLIVSIGLCTLYLANALQFLHAPSIAN
jgi:hypothetical protein